MTADKSTIDYVFICTRCGFVTETTRSAPPQCNQCGSRSGTYAPRGFEETQEEPPAS